jgi:hypothetical protein
MRARVRTVLIAIFAVLAFAVAGCGGGGSGSVASSKCKGLAHLAESAQKFSTFLTGRNPDLEKFAEEFDDFAIFSLLNIVPGAPDEIRDDLQVLDDAFSKYLDAVAGVDLGNLDQEALEKLQHPSIEIDQQKVMQASQNISAWVQTVQKNCT